MSSNDHDSSASSKIIDTKVDEERVDDIKNTSSIASLEKKNGERSKDDDDSQSPLPSASTSSADLAHKTSSTTKTSKQPTKSDVAASWEPAWSDDHQVWYWWNTITYETTWEDPTGAANGNAQSGTPDGTFDTTAGNSDPHSIPYSHYHDGLQTDDAYNYQAYFNARTGRFSSASEIERADPQTMSQENRATRQMDYYFDVGAYMDERNYAKAMAGDAKRRLTKQELAKVKKRAKVKKEKKRREWLLDK